MKAVGKYIIVDEIKDITTTTDGGLILGEKQREDIRYREGCVLHVGSDVVILKTGDSIYYDRHASFNIELKDKVLRVIKESDVVIIL